MINLIWVARMTYHFMRLFDLRLPKAYRSAMNQWTGSDEARGCTKKENIFLFSTINKEQAKVFFTSTQVDKKDF